MKEKTKKIYQLLIFYMIVVVGSCQKDNELIKKNEQKLAFGKVNLDQIPEIKKAIDQKKGNSSFKQSASVYLNLINPENIKTFTDNLGHVSYTFSLNLEEDNKLSNLLVAETNNGLKYYLIEYTSNNFEQWIQDVNNDIKSDVNAEMSFENLDAPVRLNTSKCMNLDEVTVCISGQHSSASGNLEACDLDPDTQWITSYNLSATGCGAGEEGTTIPNGGGGTTTAITEPCNNLKKLFDPAKANIKPAVNSLLLTIPNSIGENAEVFSNSSSGFNSSFSVNQTGNNLIQTPVGGDVFAIIHTHPLDTYPMFSWSDVNALNNLSNNLASHQGQAVSMLATIDDSGVSQLYAIVFNEESINTIDDFINSPENAGCNDGEVAKQMDDQLDERYRKEFNSGTTPKYELAFLRQMFGYNISLYRANVGLNNWSRLKINTLTGNITTTPCN